MHKKEDEENEYIGDKSFFIKYSLTSMTIASGVCVTTIEDFVVRSRNIRPRDDRSIRSLYYRYIYIYILRVNYNDKKYIYITSKCEIDYGSLSHISNTFVAKHYGYGIFIRKKNRSVIFHRVPYFVDNEGSDQ